MQLGRIAPEEYVARVRRAYPALPDGQLLDLVRYSPEFEGAVDSDINANFRSQVSQVLFHSFGASDRHFIRYLLEQETHYKALSSGIDHGDNLGRLALMLFDLGQPEDVYVIWNAKLATFDTFCWLDARLLLGAGIDRTVAYLKQSRDDDPEARDLCDLIEPMGDNAEIRDFAQLRLVMHAIYGNEGTSDEPKG